MNIVFLTHPEFSNIRSISLYTHMIAKGMQEREHTVQICSPKAYFNKLPGLKGAKKWLGYIDQFLIFRISLQKRIKRFPKDTLYVVSDQALGMWVPLIARKPHIVHCHDFLAQQSALGEIPENKVKKSGKIYQKLIRSGYSKADNFISISKKTKNDLHRFLTKDPDFSEVVYNGLNQKFIPGNVIEVRKTLEELIKIELHQGYILHVGGNQFYKNRLGVVKIYEKWRGLQEKKLPLLMVGPDATTELNMLASNSNYFEDIHFLQHVSDSNLQLLYQGASVLLFPSLEEGFGWPIAEAMASGCMVITTNKDPMLEVGGNSCFYIPRQPSASNSQEKDWALEGARVLHKVLNLSDQEREERKALGVENAKRFDTQKALDKIEGFYKKVLNSYTIEI